MKKKKVTLLPPLFALALLLAGCGGSPGSPEAALRVYSYCGENEFLSVSNGVIVLDGEEEIFYGGDLAAAQDAFPDITAFEITFYINGSEKEVLLSRAVHDQTGGTLDVSGSMGRASGDILKDGAADRLADDLWFELKTTALSGEENTYQVQCSVTEVTKQADGQAAARPEKARTPA